MARVRPVPASSAPSSPVSPRARARPQPSRAATRAAASSTLGPLRAGRPRVRPLPQPLPPEAPRCPAVPGDRKRPSRSRFMAAATARPRRSAPLGTAGHCSARLGPTRLHSTVFDPARLRSAPLCWLGPAARPGYVPLGPEPRVSSAGPCSLVSARLRRSTQFGSLETGRGGARGSGRGDEGGARREGKGEERGQGTVKGARGDAARPRRLACHKRGIWVPTVALTRSQVLRETT